jgi:formylglycine-generating enzyme required for sulfatase activity
MRMATRLHCPLLGTLFLVGCHGSSSSPGEGGVGPGVDAASGQVLIGAATFTMGCDPGSDPSCAAAEQPSHQVHLDAFFLDVTEVTVDAYRACAETGACPGAIGGDSAPAGTPVNASWTAASQYCAFAGGRLPTEAEWELAARGSAESRYPWGASAPTCTLANYSACRQANDRPGLEPVGSFPHGATPTGLLDLAGNVGELVADRYDPGYYAASPTENPRGPTDTTLDVVVRGGSFADGATALRTTARDHAQDQAVVAYLGFRCARSAN